MQEEKDREISSLRGNLDETMSSNRGLKNDNATLTNENEQLKADIKSATSEKQQLSNDLSTLTSDVSALQQKFQQLQDRNDSLQQAKDAADQARADAEDAKAAAESDRARLEGQLANLSGQIGELQGMVESQGQTVERLESEKAALVAAGVEVERIIGNAVPALNANVSAIGPNFVVLNVGDQAGVKVGYPFDVYRGADYIGRVVVYEVQPDTCVARVQIKNQRGLDFRQGDSATTRL
jgi:uncharacterized phage infection (PIP) family protein YhgE